MFEIYEYKVRDVLKTKTLTLVGKITSRKIVAKFKNLDEARAFIEGKSRHYIAYPKKLVKGQAA